tara:strand:- start:237 stop:593 length:357 start_codon:yes stop_codon:yes gene_type:complete
LLVIRLQRTGRRNLATFRIVVAEKSAAVKKKIVEAVGHYLPTQTPKVLEANQERIVYWISKGAKPSATVASLLKSLGMKDMDKYMTQPNKKAKKKNASDEPEEAPAQEESAPAEEATA